MLCVIVSTKLNLKIVFLSLNYQNSRVLNVNQRIERHLELFVSVKDPEVNLIFKILYNYLLF